MSLLGGIISLDVNRDILVNVGIARGSHMTSIFFCPKICQLGSCFVDKMTRNTTVQTDRKSDTRFTKYDHLKQINQSNHAININLTKFSRAIPNIGAKPSTSQLLPPFLNI